MSEIVRICLGGFLTQALNAAGGAQGVGDAKTTASAQNVSLWSEGFNERGFLGRRLPQKVL